MTKLLLHDYGASLKYHYKPTNGENAGKKLNFEDLLLLDMASANDSASSSQEMLVLVQNYRTVCGNNTTECNNDATHWCSHCKTIGYCCREHQSAHWKTGHRETCKALLKHRRLVKKVHCLKYCPVEKVQLVGLVSAKELNGLIGRRISFDETAERYKIVFDNPDQPSRRVKEVNFVVLDEDGMNQEQLEINAAAESRLQRRLVKERKNEI